MGIIKKKIKKFVANETASDSIEQNLIKNWLFWVSVKNKWPKKVKILKINDGNVSKIIMYVKIYWRLEYVYLNYRDFLSPGCLVMI